MSALEEEVEALRRQLVALTERVRLSAVAEEFLRGEQAWRPGDHFTDETGSMCGRLWGIREDGKWGCTVDGTGWDRSPISGASRLYTRAEVSEIVAKVVDDIDPRTPG